MLTSHVDWVLQRLYTANLQLSGRFLLLSMLQDALTFLHSAITDLSSDRNPASLHGHLWSSTSRRLLGRN